MFDDAQRRREEEKRRREEAEQRCSTRFENHRAMREFSGSLPSATLYPTTFRIGI
jgi:hypothetical protein